MEDNTPEIPVNKEESEDDGNVITLDQFIEEETRLETDANALLGPSDDKNCTYNQGYMGRQALYSCKTCRSEDGARVAGVCLACTYHCHEGHDLVELYTKRNFRCDCGNSRFKDKKCNLEPIKDAENNKNSYNHNFEGNYCTCNRPYPDPEDSIADEMIQCIVCEDWYHTRHLNADMPSEENYAEMICTDCTEKLTFLKKYFGYCVIKSSKEETSSVDVEKNGNKSSTMSKDNSSIVAANGDISQTSNNKVVSAVTENIDGATSNSTESNQVSTNGVDSKIDVSNDVQNVSDTSSTKTSMDVQIPTSSSPDKISSSDCSKDCLLKNLKEIIRDKKGATFWPHNFRTLLCSCDSCKTIYSSLGVSYILDTNDTVQSYEDKGKSGVNSDGNKPSLERVLGMLSNIGMDRFSQAEAILNYNDLKSNLMEYLSKFVENKKVVREEDIHEFFTQMKAKKRQKLDLPYNCR